MAAHQKRLVNYSVMRPPPLQDVLQMNVLSLREIKPLCRMRPKHPTYHVFNLAHVPMSPRARTSVLDLWSRSNDTEKEWF